MDELQPLRPETYVVVVAQKLWDNLPQVIWGGVLFALCCIPAFVLFAVGLLAPTVILGALTIAPAWTALLAYEQALLTHDTAHTSLFFAALSTHWRRSAFLGGLAAFPLLVMLLTLPLLAQAEIPLLVWAGLGADFLGLALLATLLLYAFPLLVQQERSVRILLRDSLILASRQPFNTVGLLGMVILFAFAVAYLSLGLLFLLPAVYGMFVVGNCYLVVTQE